MDVTCGLSLLFGSGGSEPVDVKNINYYAPSGVEFVEDYATARQKVPSYIDLEGGNVLIETYSTIYGSNSYKYYQILLTGATVTGIRDLTTKRICKIGL